MAAHGVPLPAGEELDERPQWPRLLQGLVPPLLPVQPGRRGVGQQDRVGPRGVARPGPLAAPPAGHGPRPVVRRQRRLDGLRHHPPRRPPRHALHRLHQRVGAGAVPRRALRPLRPAPHQLDQVRRQPGAAPAPGDRPEGLPRPDHRLVRPLRPHLARRHRVQGRRGPRRHRRRLPDRGPGALRAPPGPPPPRRGHGHVGVRRLLPRRDAPRRGGRAGRRHVGRHRRERRRGGGGRGARDEGQHGRRPPRLLRAREVRRQGQRVDAARRRQGRRHRRPPLRLGQVLRVQDLLRPGQAPPRALGLGRRDRLGEGRRRQGVGVATVDPPDGAVRHQDGQQPAPVARGGGRDAAHQLHGPQRHHHRPRLGAPARPPPRHAARHRRRVRGRPPRRRGARRGRRRLQLQHQRRRRRPGRPGPLRPPRPRRPAAAPRADRRLLLRRQGPRRRPHHALLPGRVAVLQRQRRRQARRRQRPPRGRRRGDALAPGARRPLHRRELRAGGEVHRHLARLPDRGHLRQRRRLPLQQRHRRPGHGKDARRARDGLVLQPRLRGTALMRREPIFFFFDIYAERRATHASFCC